jgi:lysophospholipase L1-like esterase
VVAFGDSITDGFLGLSAQTRGWPGRLAERMAQLPAARRCSVVNMGISGNRVLRAGRATSALDRFWRDVASVPNVTHVIFLEGINDIGAGSNEGPGAVKPDDLIRGYRQFVARAHALGIKVIGGTMTPALHAGYMSPVKDQTRMAVNAAIRGDRIFDGVVDFEAAVHSPAVPTDLRPEFDPGDHLHPNDAGLRAMGDAVNLTLLTPQG